MFVIGNKDILLSKLCPEVFKVEISFPFTESWFGESFIERYRWKACEIFDTAQSTIILITLFIRSVIVYRNRAISETVRWRHFCATWKPCCKKIDCIKCHWRNNYFTCSKKVAEFKRKWFSIPIELLRYITHIKESYFTYNIN